jgi:hypothetical protein
VPVPLYGNALYAAGGMDFMTGRWESGAERNRMAAELFKELGNDTGVLWSRVYEAVCVAGTGDDGRARLLTEKAREAARDATDRGPFSRATLSLTWAEMDHDLDRAAVLAEEGERVSHELGSLFDRAHAREASAYLQALQGNLGEAQTLVVEALRLYEEGRIVNCGAHCLETAAAIAGMARLAETAAELWGAADRIRERTGDVPRPWERTVQERWLPAIRERLDEDAFRAARDRGLAMGWRAAVTHAEAALSPARAKP